MKKTIRNMLHTRKESILYIISEVERKWFPTITEVMTNRITTYPKFKYV